MKKKYDQFQVGYMLNPESNINKAFKEKDDINLEKSFKSTTIMPVRKVFQKGNICVISLLMYYEN